MKTVNLTPELCIEFCKRPIRPEDVHEWESGLGQPPSPMILWVNFKEAEYRKAILDDEGVPVVLFGCADRGGVGWVSLIGADRPELVAYIHREMGHVEWPKVLGLHDTHMAISHANQTLHHKWLERVGFVAIDRKVPINGHYYVQFKRVAYVL